MGGVSAALYAYLSEFNIPRHRAVAINYSTMFVSVTAIYVPGIYSPVVILKEYIIYLF